MLRGLGFTSLEMQAEILMEYLINLAAPPPFLNPADKQQRVNLDQAERYLVNIQLCIMNCFCTGFQLI